jgi:hypothetical protein
MVNAALLAFGNRICAIALSLNLRVMSSSLDGW